MHLEESSVDFTSSNKNFTGELYKIWLQDTGKLAESGVAARIKWNDGVTSSILFLENSKVRVWEKGTEFNGEWEWDSAGVLRVEMEKGSQYRFFK